MMIHPAFQIFAGLMVAASAGVILFRKPIHNLLSLLIVLLNLAFIFFLFNASFLALISSLVYLGAVMILFLFFIMTIGAAEENSSQLTLTRHKNSFFITFAIIVLETAYFFLTKESSFVSEQNTHSSSLQVVGSLLYSKYGIILQILGLILLVAIMGSILLSLKSNNRIGTDNDIHSTRSVVLHKKGSF